MNLKELFNNYKTQLNRIAEDEQSGKITAQKAEFSRNQLTEEYESALAEFESGADEEVAEFAAGNSLGATLIEIGEKAGYEDPEEFLIDLSAQLEISPEDAYDLITSDVEPDEDLVEDVLDTLLADDDDESEYEGEEEYEEEELDEDEYEEEASYSNSRLNELEEEMAEFKLGQELKLGLSQLRNEALNLLDEGAITSFGYNLLFPDTDSDDELLAYFSSAVERNNTNIETELIRTQGVIEFCKKAFGGTNIFADVIAQEEDARFSQQDSDPEEDAIAIATARQIYKSLN